MLNAPPERSHRLSNNQSAWIVRVIGPKDQHPPWALWGCVPSIEHVLVSEGGPFRRETIRAFDSWGNGSRGKGRTYFLVGLAQEMGIAGGVDLVASREPLCQQAGDAN